MAEASNKLPFQAILFDLDGTLLDTAYDIMDACNHTLIKFGFNPVAEDILRTKVTAGMREMLKLGIPEHLRSSVDIEGAMRNEFAAYYTSHICDRTQEFNGVDSLFEKLQQNGIKTAVITNKYEKMAHKVLSSFTFSNKLSLVLGCDSTKHSKPHPEPLLKALEKIQTPPSQSLYVGDHLNDILAAKNAGCKSCAALWGYGQNECGDASTWNSDYKADNIEDLSKLIFNPLK